MKVIIVRHGKVDMKWSGYYNSEQFDEDCKQYNKANIIPINSSKTSNNMKLYVSDLKRSKETAKQLFKNKEIHELKEIAEVPLKSFCDTRLRLPLWLWNVIGRLQWYINSERQVEIRKETEKRAKFVIEYLENQESDCILVTHGFFMKILIKQYEKCGYQVNGNKKLGFGNLQTVTVCKEL